MPVPPSELLSADVEPPLTHAVHHLAKLAPSTSGSSCTPGAVAVPRSAAAGGTRSRLDPLEPYAKRGSSCLQHFVRSRPRTPMLEEKPAILCRSTPTLIWPSRSGYENAQPGIAPPCGSRRTGPNHILARLRPLPTLQHITKAVLEQERLGRCVKRRDLTRRCVAELSGKSESRRHESSMT